MDRRVGLCVLAIVPACPHGPVQPDAYCGAGSASGTGLVATAGSTTLVFTNLSASPNNDCPASGAPKGVVAMTIEPPSGTDPLLTICTGRPDLVPGGLAIGSAAQIIDVSGTSGGCTFTLDDTVAPTGTLSATGLCDAGSAHAGFALTVDAVVSLTRTCGTTVDQVTAMLSGTSAIAGP
jgi:hypothetical protein